MIASNILLSNASLNNFVELLVVLVIFLFVIAITILTTKFIGGYQKTQYMNKNLKMIETMRMANDKYISLIQVGEVYLVVGVGKNEIHEIAKLTKEELPEIISLDTNNQLVFKNGFQDTLNRLMKKNKED